MNRDRIRAWGQELRLVHATLRRRLARVRSAVERGTPAPAVTEDLRLFCAGFCSALTRHHTAEDSVLFARVFAAHPDLESTIAKLIEDHALLASLITGLEDAAADASPHLVQHLDGIEAIMTSHFGFEERRLVELLDSVGDDTVPIPELLGIEPDSPRR